MAEKPLNTRIQQKHDTQVNWEKATGFIPKAGEVIVYDADENYSYPRIKIGNGEATVSELPFAASQPDWDAAQGEEGYIWNKPNVVTSVNGVSPDENGNVQTPQANWKQNDETAPDYIKGRTHYVVRSQETVFNEYTVSNKAGAWIQDQKLLKDVIVGNKYTVTYNSTDYEVIAYEHPYFGTSLGNASLPSSSEADTGEPFYFGNLMTSIPQVLAYFSTSDVHVFSIKGIVDTYYPLNGKYVGGGVYPGTGVGATTIGSNLAIASGKYSVAVNTSYAKGDYAFAENKGTAEGYQSHAEGHSYAKALCSHAEGFYTFAESDYQHTQGKWNVSDTEGEYAHIVGNGKAHDNRSNAHTLDWSGNAWFSGDVYVGSTSGANKDEGSKKLATEEFVNTAVAGVEIPSVDGLATEEYVNNAITNIDYPVDSVNGKTGAVNLTAEDVGAASTADFNETIIGLEVNGKVVTYIKGDGSRHSFETQDTDTIYSLATDEVTGLTKLYATIGSAEDGTMTQKAIKTELDKKVGVTVNNSTNTLVFTI